MEPQQLFSEAFFRLFSAYGANFCGFKIHRGLINLGIKNIVVNPADIPTTDKERKQKEGSRDSRKLAKQLSQNDLTAIYVPGTELEGDRKLVRYRKTLGKRTGQDKEPHKITGISFWHQDTPQFSGKSYWSKKFTGWPASLQLLTESAKKILLGHLEMAGNDKKETIFHDKRNKGLIEKGDI